MKTILPGLNGQLEFLKKYLLAQPSSVLVIGSSSESIAQSITTQYNSPVDLIVGDYESLMNSKVVLGAETKINLRMMSFDSTDFMNEQFDLVYAQASISINNRNKIVKEIKRILKPGGYFCVGEVTALTKEIPQYITDIFDTSDMLPLFTDDLSKYYLERNFKVCNKINLSNTLKEYYSFSANALRDIFRNLGEKEKSYYKKLINKISHESNSYLKLGGHRHMGFEVMLLRKGDN
jgi:ubiquinone/menaquinone biosynthesis C-methylase UbiE